MSLQRFTNFEKLNSSNRPMYGELYSDTDYQILQSKDLYTLIKSVNEGSLFTEAHVYTLGNDYLGSIYDNRLLLDADSNSLFVDAREVFSNLGIRKGSYKLAVNVFVPIYGRPGSEFKPPVFIDEISPDRNEIKLVLKDGENKIQLQQFRDYVFSYNFVNLLNFLSINFGGNNVYRILNIRFDEKDPLVFYVKIHGELADSVEEYDGAWFGVEAVDSYIDNVILTTESDIPVLNKLRGPKFDIDVDQWDSNATMYQSWNQLLDANAPTAQRIIDNIISGSGQATINIDYTDYENFIFYSSASDRLANFKRKVEQIELYNNDITVINNSVSPGQNLSVFSRRSKDTLQTRIDTLVSAFDPFERWMYYQQSGSIFTHDITGSVTPWPKYETGNKYVLHPSTSSIVKNWYTENYQLANEYDLQNQNSLWWSIPEHVLMDANNSEYITFVNMIGQHFDVMYMYVNALTKIHERDEHPERGASNDLLYYIAKSYGWNLQNARGLSSLWLYKLGTDSTGSFQTSSGLSVLPHERQTQLIWRRIVNNLPYLLKTKGTDRSVKALMSIYGIPQTLLSIKEYGGPGIDSDIPIAIENMFTYKLNVNGNQNNQITIAQELVSASYYGWGNGSWCNATPGQPIVSRTPDTYEFRFSTKQSGSLGAIPLFVKRNATPNFPEPYGLNSVLSLVSALELTGTGSVSGSTEYGKLVYEDFISGDIQYSNWLPVFDGDLWTVRLYNETPISGTILNERVQIAKASDYLYGRVVHESAMSMSGVDYTSQPIDYVYLGGKAGIYYYGPSLTGSIINNYTFTPHDFTTWFSGSLQSYKEYYTIYGNETFRNHVLNPGAYNVDTPSGSFYSLYRYYPLGGDVQRFDHTTHLYLSSSHPDRTKQPTPASMSGFTGNQESQYESINETYYSQVPKVGGIPIRNEKIRIEENSLRYELSPESRGEQSEYDDKPTDTNRLAIVFSTADYLNRDIANHMGFSDLDTWIADPEEEFENEYKTLQHRRNDYFQKFNNKNDLNSFIRILSLYDYTFFEQLKQLVPGRSDLITGILIEPHILDRSKVQISKRPKVTNPQWDRTIVYTVSQSGVFPTYKADIQHEKIASVGYFYETGSVELAEVVDTSYGYIESEIASPFEFETTAKENETGSIRIRDPYETFASGSIIRQIDTMRPNCRYSKKVCYYDAYPLRYSLFRESNIQSGSLQYWVTESYNPPYLVSEETSSYKWDNIVGEYRFKSAFHMPLGTIISQSVTTVKDAKYLIRVFAAPYTSGSVFNFDETGGYNYEHNLLNVSIITSGSPIEYSIYDLDTVKPIVSGSKKWLREYRYYITGSGADTIKFRAGNIFETFPATREGIFLYTAEIHPYLTPWQEGWAKRAYELGDRSHVREGCVLENWYYQIDECSSQNNSRFAGSKLSGPGINIDSPNTVDGGPVVVVQVTSPNNLILGDRGAEGNLRLE